MRDFYFCLAGGAVQPVKARDLTTAAALIQRRGDPEVRAVFVGEECWRSAVSMAVVDGADEPTVRDLLIARSGFAGVV